MGSLAPACARILTIGCHWRLPAEPGNDRYRGDRVNISYALFCSVALIRVAGILRRAGGGR